jgi:hypothetical protein
MRFATVASAIALITTWAALTVVESIVGTGLYPETPLNSGSLGILSVALFLVGAATLFWMPRHAAIGFGVAAAVMLVHSYREADLWPGVWTLAELLICELAAITSIRERRAEQRAAIHARIDEEIVDSTRLA